VAAGERLDERKASYAELLKEEAEAFTAEVAAFRADFRDKAPFAYECGSDSAYTLMDEWQAKLLTIEDKADALRDREHLFDARVHPWKDLALCRTELGQLKLLWDHAVLIECIFGAWQATPWAKVDCDACYGHSKRLQSQVAALEKRVRAASNWGVYKGTMTAVAEMLVTLPLVQDLRDEAMRERHWKKLMRTCGRTFVLDAKFCLRDLFRLQLHKFADAVGDIVEQSRQEIKIDKHLQKIDSAWLVLALEYSMFKATGVKVIVEASLGPVFEALDEHEAALQGMMGNRFVGFFENQVSSWRS
jgi:dynein heavy chain